MFKKLITPSLFVLIAALSAWYIKALDKSLAQKTATVTQGPDYFMHDTVSTILDDSGKLKHRLQTAYMAHFPEDNRTELEHAYLTLHQQDGSLWSVKANRGKLYQDSEQIFLTGDVVIEKPQSAGPSANDAQTGIKIQTDRLHIDPNLQIAQTEDAVVISNQDLRVDAIGMKANFQTKSVELLAKVRGTYAPQHEPAP